MTVIGKWIEFDAGHRVPNHTSKCRNPHGHRYRVEVFVGGEVIDDPFAPDDGMVIDFGVVKELLMEHVHDVLDHGFMVHVDDTAMLHGLELGQDKDGNWNVVVMMKVPTAENIAEWVAERLGPLLAERRVRLSCVTVNETPTSSATFYYHGDVDR